MTFLLPIRKNFILFLLGINLIVLPIIFYMNRAAGSGRQIASQKKAHSVYGQMPHFKMTERNGQSVTDEQMKGSVWVANFIFTRCPNQCPMMSVKFSALQKTLPASVRLVSFTVDPEYDSPEKLSVYAKSYGADDKKWLFLTGDKETTQSILSALHLSNGEDPGAHSLRFVLLDPKLQVLGYYDSEDSRALQRLKSDIKNMGHGS